MKFNTPPALSRYGSLQTSESSPDDAAEYKGLKIHASANLHERCMSVIGAIDLPEDAQALDLGAGEGAFSQRLIDSGFKVSAAELEPGRFRVDAHCQNLDLNSDFHDTWDEEFDLVVAIEIIEHLHNPRHFINNCLRLLKEDGYLLITSPNVESWLSRIRFLRDGHLLWFEESDYSSYGHVTPIFSWQIAQICRELGVELVEVSKTKNSLLLKRLGERFRDVLRNKSFYLGALYPLMKGGKEGEINIYLIRKSASGLEAAGLVNASG